MDLRSQMCEFIRIMQRKSFKKYMDRISANNHLSLFSKETVNVI